MGNNEIVFFRYLTYMLGIDVAEFIFDIWNGFLFFIKKTELILYLPFLFLGKLFGKYN